MSERSRLLGLGVLLWGLLVPQAVTPANISVKAPCTLANAIRAANLDTSVGGCAKGSGADKVVLTGDVLLTNEDNPDNGLPQITSDVTIRGNNFRVDRASGAPAFRIFDVTTEGRLTLEDVTVANGSLGKARGAGIRAYGDLTLENSTVSGNETNDRGGGIFAQGDPYPGSGFTPRVTLINSTVSNNSAQRGGGIAAYEYSYLDLVGATVAGNEARARGGGFLLVGGQTTITSSTISGNAATSGAGLRASEYAGVLLTESTVSGNESRLEGGGIFGRYAQIELVRSRVTNNSADVGGGIYFGTGYFDLRVTSSTISNNRADTAGGGIHLLAISGEVEASIWNSTVSGNSAPMGGGAYVYHVYYRNEMSLRQTTVSGNSATAGAGIYFKQSDVFTHSMYGSLIAGNDGPNCSGGGAFTVSGVLDDDSSCGGAAITAGVDFDAELRENGGPTPTHALLAGSAAIDSVDCFFETDQRGFGRVGACDAGAFEFGVDELGMATVGVSPRKAVCKNLTDKKTRRRRGIVEIAWLCGDLNVDFDPGERARVTAVGVANGVIPVGGSISGLDALTRVTCKNRTTGEKVSFTPPLSEWDCEGEGLDVSAGDSVSQKVRGRV